MRTSIDSVSATVATASAPSRDDEEHIDDGEHRLEAELEHHRNRQHQDGGADRAFGVVAVAAGQRFANGRPEAATGGDDFHGTGYSSSIERGQSSRSNRDSDRSARRRPPVWQRAQ